VKGHNHDQWNDAADALAVLGRDEAIKWLKCSFEVIMSGVQIPFPKRALRGTTMRSDLSTQLTGETHINIQSYRDLASFKDTNDQLVHKSLPSPAAARPVVPDPAAPRLRPAIFGIYDGKKFMPTQPI
jgi:hypothetical protein